MNIMLSITLSLIMIRDLYTQEFTNKLLTKKYNYIFNNIFQKCNTQNKVSYTDIIKKL